MLLSLVWVRVRPVGFFSFPLGSFHFLWVLFICFEFFSFAVSYLLKYILKLFGVLVAFLLLIRMVFLPMQETVTYLCMISIPLPSSCQIPGEFQ